MERRAPTSSDQQKRAERSKRGAASASSTRADASTASFTDQQSSYLAARYGRPWAVEVPVHQGFRTNRYVDVVLGALAGGTLVGVITDVIDAASLTGVLAIIHGFVLPVVVILASRKAGSAPRKSLYLAQAETWTDEG